MNSVHAVSLRIFLNYNQPFNYISYVFVNMLKTIAVSYNIVAGN